MLWYERQLVDALTTVDDPAGRAAVAGWVDESLAGMPEGLRAGVATGSVLLGVWIRLAGHRGPELVAALERSALPPVRQHLRLIRSLVLFGDIELAPDVAA